MFKKKELKTKNFDLGKTIAKVFHNDGTIYTVTKYGKFQTWINKDDLQYFSNEEMHKFLEKSHYLTMDCETIIFKDAVNKIILETSEHFVEGTYYEKE